MSDQTLEPGYYGGGMTAFDVWIALAGLRLSMINAQQDAKRAAREASDMTALPEER